MLFIFTIFCYGSESWTLSKALEAKIEAMEMWCLRKIGNVKSSDMITNESVGRTGHTETIIIE